MSQDTSRWSIRTLKGAWDSESAGTTESFTKERTATILNREISLLALSQFGSLLKDCWLGSGGGLAGKR